MVKGWFEWRDFYRVIEKAKTACIKSGNNPGDHFADVNKTIGLGIDPKLNRPR